MNLRRILLILLPVLLRCADTVVFPGEGYNLFQPAVSPDGTEIAFTLFDGIWVAPSSGGRAEQVTSGHHIDDLPKWIPGPARQLSFRSRRGPEAGLYMIDLATHAEREIPGLRRPFRQAVPAYDWLPDGQHLVAGLDQSILEIHAASGTARTIVASTAEPVMSLDCSPDGAHIAYDVRNYIGYQERLSEMHCVAVDGSRSAIITKPALEHYTPVWSPDGRAIAFSGYDAGTNDIYICTFNPQTWEFGTPRRLTEDPREETNPVWSANGREIYLEGNPHARAELFRVPANGGPLTPVAITGLQFRGETGRLSLTVHDDATGDVVPARVYLRTADGRTYYPSGAFPRLTGFFHSMGESIVTLPAGEVTVEVMRGFEYEVEKQTVSILPNSTAEIDIRLQRWIDMAARGWYSADNHFHANYQGPFFMYPEQVMTMLEAEDLNIGNMVSGNSWAARLYDREFFTGHMDPLSKDRYLLRWNQEYRSTAYGHLILMNLKDMVAPYLVGFTLSDVQEDYPPLIDAIRAAQEQGGTAHFTHPISNIDPMAGDYHAFELPVDCVLGKMDALDIAGAGTELLNCRLYYRLLNCGFRMAVSAGTDCFTSRISPPPGYARVYARTGDPFDFNAWMQAFREGKTFATNGPILNFSVNGQEPGSELPIDEKGTTLLRIETHAQSRFPMDSLQIIMNGEVIHHVIAGDDGREASLSLSLPVDRSCWIAARVLGPRHPLVLDAHVFAHSSPVYVQKGTESVASAKDAEYFIWWIDEVLKRVDARDRWTRPEHKRRVHELFRNAQEYYRRMASRGPV